MRQAASHPVTFRKAPHDVGKTGDLQTWWGNNIQGVAGMGAATIYCDHTELVVHKIRDGDQYMPSCQIAAVGRDRPSGQVTQWPSVGDATTIYDGSCPRPGCGIRGKRKKPPGYLWPGRRAQPLNPELYCQELTCNTLGGQLECVLALIKDAGLATVKKPQVNEDRVLWCLKMNGIQQWM